MKILVSDPLSDDGLEILKKSGIAVDVKTGLKEDELCKIIGEYDGLIIRSGTKVTAKVIESAKKLRVVGRAGVGVDNVDIPAATAKGILVMNTPSANILSAAEHTCAMIMSLVRNIPMAHKSMHEGKWERSKFTGTELNGKTLGIIGVGRVGGEVAKRLKHFNMEMLGYDPFLPKEVADAIGVKLTTLDDVIEHSDIMTIHTPLLPETRGMIALPQFKKMKKSAMLVNVARGGIVKEDDLYTALKDKIISGAAFDVWENEPLNDTEKKLLELDNLVTTPHLGASTVEAQERVAVDIANSAVKFFKEGVIENAINAPRGKLDPMLSPYVDLAEYLGRIALQIIGSKPIESIEVSACGAISEKDTKRITVAAVVGVLSKIVSEKPNIVNALSIAKEKGIEIKDVKTAKTRAYENTVIVKIAASGKTVELEGTAFGGIARLTRVDKLTFESPILGDLIIGHYKDKIGVIASIGKALSDNGINVAQMTVGRDVKSKNVIMLITVDSELDEKAKKKIRETGIFDAIDFVCIH